MQKKYNGLLLGFEPLKGHVSEYDERKKGEQSIRLASNKTPFSELLKRFIKRVDSEVKKMR